MSNISWSFRLLGKYILHQLANTVIVSSAEPHRPRYRSGLDIIVALFLVTITLAACSSTQQIYEQAYFSHDVDQLESFIREYPDNRYVADAKRHQAKWLMEKAAKNPSIATYEALIKKYPHNPNLYTQATNKLSSLYFQEVEKENSLSALEDFVKKFPFSRERHFAAVQIDKLKYEKALASKTMAAYRDYLHGKPSSENRKRIEEKIAELELDEIKNNESIEAYQKFISQHSDSPLAVEATNRMVNMQLPSSVYRSPKGSILIRWGKVGMIQNNHLDAHFGENQKQQFLLSKNLVVCNDRKKKLALDKLAADSDITVASFADQNQSEVFAIYLGEVKTKMVERENALVPQSAISFDLPNCFPPQIGVNP